MIAKWRTALHAAWLAYKLARKQRLCRHEFHGRDMVTRKQPTDRVKWPCHKCGKVFDVEYGLQVEQFGKIIGDW